MGDVIWVKETFAEIGCIGWDIDKFEYAYRADFAHNYFDWEGTADMCFEKWKPSLFMPKVAARIRLKVTGLSCEQLQHISELDAIAEGIEKINGGYKDYTGKIATHVLNPINSYQTLWESINGKGSWNINPYVWVIQFKPL